MKRLVVVVGLAIAATVALATPASAWPPVCKPIVYDHTGICI